MSEFNIEDLDAVIAQGREGSLAQMLALQLKGQIRKSEQLAAENVALKESRTILVENTLETCNEIASAGFRNEAIMRGLYKSTGNRNKHPKPITTLVDEALRKLETPSTDRIYAGIKADGVEEWVSSRGGRWNGTTEEALKFAAQLRKGASE